MKRRWALIASAAIVVHGAVGVYAIESGVTGWEWAVVVVGLAVVALLAVGRYCRTER